MQPASPLSPSLAGGRPGPKPDAALPQAPRPPGMFCGYQVEVGHPAWQEPRQPRVKRPAHEMEASLPDGKAQAPDAKAFQPRPQEPQARDQDRPPQAKRPYAPTRPVPGWVDPDFASFKHPLSLAGEDDPAPDPAPVPQPLGPQEADALLLPLAGSQEGLALDSLQAALARERFARRHLVAPSKQQTSIAQVDAGALGQAVARHWGGALLSDQRLDFLAHQVSHEAGLTLREDAGDLEQAMFVRGVFSATTDTAMIQRWAGRVLEQGFSRAHAAHPAYPFVGRGTLRVLLRALSCASLAEQMVPFLLGQALVPRSRLRDGDARLQWRGADLQVAVAVARAALHKAGTVHPALVRWVARADAFPADELGFLAAGIGTRVPLRADLAGDEDATSSQAAPACWSPEILGQWGKAFFHETTLGDTRLATACLGLASGIGYPARLLHGQGLVDSLSRLEMMHLGRAVGWLVAGAADPQAAAARVGQSMLCWVVRDAGAKVKAGQRKEWDQVRRDTLGVYLVEAARHFDPPSLEALLADIRQQLHGGVAWSLERAERFLCGILPPPPAEPDGEAAWERVRQNNTLVQVLTATPAPPRPKVAEPLARGED